MKNQKRLRVSTHETLNGSLVVNWDKDYKGEFECPKGCGKNLFLFLRSGKNIEFECKKCHARSSLKNPYSKPAISFHETLHDLIKVDWRQEANHGLQCPLKCGSKRIGAHISRGKVFLECKACKARSNLQNKLSPHISRYRADIECLNPICDQSWVYLRRTNRRSQKVYCCKSCSTIFCLEATSSLSWAALNKPVQKLFNFDDDRWSLRLFFQDPRDANLNFESVKPEWYQELVKQYIYYCLSIYTHQCSWIESALITLRIFGQTVQQNQCTSLQSFTRQLVLSFLLARQGLNAHTVNSDIRCLLGFFDWLGLESNQLLRSRDRHITIKNEPDWLDEEVRKVIQDHLHKIPSFIAHQYILQEYTAARLGDACLFPYDCLIEEDNKWYVQFFQNKVKRMHRIPATREIRKIIEKQQKWIKEKLGEEYEYLFCHFRNARKNTYPNFPTLQPIPIHPTALSTRNAMVKIIRIMIDVEDIRDSNGKKAKFTGKITRPSKLQEIRTKHGIEVASKYADHKSVLTTLQHYAPPTREQIAEVDLPFQELLLNQSNKFLPWQSLPESLMQNPQQHELDIEVSSRLTVYGYCALTVEQKCPKNLYPKCYGCSSFRPPVDKLPLYIQQYEGEKKRMMEAKDKGIGVAYEEAKSTLEAMDLWLHELKEVADG